MSKKGLFRIEFMILPIKIILLHHPCHAQRDMKFSLRVMLCMARINYTLSFSRHKLKTANRCQCNTHDNHKET
jgi:hypothetical protein